MRNDGNLIAEFARERRIYVPFKAIPDRLVELFSPPRTRPFISMAASTFRASYGLP